MQVRLEGVKCLVAVVQQMLPCPPLLQRPPLEPLALLRAVLLRWLLERLWLLHTVLERSQRELSSPETHRQGHAAARGPQVVGSDALCSRQLADHPAPWEPRVMGLIA